MHTYLFNIVKKKHEYIRNLFCEIEKYSFIDYRRNLKLLYFGFDHVCFVNKSKNKYNPFNIISDNNRIVLNYSLRAVW